MTRKGSRSRFRKILWAFVAASGLMLVLGVWAAVALLLHLSKDLPDPDSLLDYEPSTITVILDRNDEPIENYYIERRTVVPINRIPWTVIQAFVAAEDANFYRHQGIDIRGIFRALMKNLRAGEVVQGGSTITQQVVKSLLLTPEKSYKRKVREAILAYRIERKFTKEQIINLYLNQIYLGYGAYGVEAAALTYFGKHVDELDLAESALLAGLPRAPSRYSPFANPELARERQVYALRRMVEEGYIDEKEMNRALQEEPILENARSRGLGRAPYFAEYVRKYIEDKYGSDTLYREGLKVKTTLDLELQTAAEAAIARGLRALDRRQGYRGPLRRLEADERAEFSEALIREMSGDGSEPGDVVEGVVTVVDDAEELVHVDVGLDFPAMLTFTELKWALGGKKGAQGPFRAGDVVALDVTAPAEGVDEPGYSLHQNPLVQGALVALDPETGEILAMVGGYDFGKSKFNRVVQARRQAGSAFKPIIYAAALDRGYTATTRLVDSPIIYEDPDTDFKWKPWNFEKRFFGPISFRDALIHSRNVVTIKILKDLGTRYATDYARRLGIRSPISQDLSMALGSSCVSPLELTSAFGVFANKGSLARPFGIVEITDRRGEILDQWEPRVEPVISEQTAYIMTSLLTSVVQHGTGRKVKALRRPCAGKTGTTNEFIDAWFIGFTPSLVAGVWTGFDQERSLGANETGSRAASPIWLDFMKQALDEEPVEDFTVPSGIVFARIDKETGLLAGPDSGKTIFECFIEGTAPTEVAMVDKAEEPVDYDMIDKEDFEPLWPEEDPVP
ncbi:penicillin-binding protein 1A [Thermodesulfobacteriota bacterium]